MNDDANHTVHLDVPEWAMPSVLKAMRMLREAHRDAGGTSKLTRNGRKLTATFVGSPIAVAEAARTAAKFEEQVIKAREESKRKLIESAERDRSRYINEIYDELLNRGLIR